MDALLANEHAGRRGKLGLADRLRVRRYLTKAWLNEFLKFDARPWMLPASLALFLVARVALWRGHYRRYHSLMSSLFGSGWRGSYSLVAREYRRVFASPTQLGERLIAEAVESTQPLGNTRKFFADPRALFEGVVIVLKPSLADEKGVLLIKYSYYFTLMFKLFDMEQLAEHYHLVLEPSWAGYADLSILAYTAVRHPVFVMTYEQRDRRFLLQLESNLVPVDVGPSWWVDHRMFMPGSESEKRFDLIMVAAWSSFKRHHRVFRAISRLRKEGMNLRIALAGYGTQFKPDWIWTLASYYDIADAITLYEKVPPEAVSQLFRQSRINVLWSRFEGNNRSIIEGMFCDVPCIMRQGHNFGDRYFYINEQTGRFAGEADLPETIRAMLRNLSAFSPRRFVLNKMCYEVATERLEQAIRSQLEEAGIPFSGSLAMKVNELDGMRYVDVANRTALQPDYDRLAGLIDQSALLPLTPAQGGAQSR